MPRLCSDTFFLIPLVDVEPVSEGVNQEAGMITLKIKLVERYTYRPNNAIQNPPVRKHEKKAAGQLRIG